MKNLLSILVFVVSLAALDAGEAKILFDGSNLKAWDYPEGAWVIDADGSLTCLMQEVTVKKDGTKRIRGRGYIWTKLDFGDFELKLSYKLTEGANSGVFYRTDKNDPVHGGFEIQLMDNEEFQKSHGIKDGKKLNGSFYEGKAPASNPAKPIGEWNTLKLTCQGPNIGLSMNGVQIIDVNVDDWDTAGKNPDGTSNKFKTALKDLPRSGKIGLQNHGQVVWFKDISIKKL